MGHKRRKCCRCPQYSNCFEKGCCVWSWCLQLSAEPTAFSTVGQIIDLRFTITNNGNTDLFGCAEIDECCMFTLFLPNFCLERCKTTTVSRPYVVTQADLDAGQISFRGGITLQIKKRKYLTACDNLVIPRLLV